MGVVTATITSNGASIPPEYELLYIDITSEFNRIPNAEVSFIDGDLPKRKFPVSDGKYFEPGREIEIKLRYEGKPQQEKTVFKGLVLKQALQMNGNGCTVTAELSDAAVKMTTTRKNAIFENITDSDLIKKLLTESGLNTGTISTTKVQHKSIIQYYASNWDFMLGRAEVNGLLISVKEGSVSAIIPGFEKAAKHKYEFGIDDIFDFDFEADARNQFSSIEGISWDVKKQQLTSAVKAKSFSLPRSDLSVDKLANAVGAKKDTLISAVTMNENEVQAWADSKMIKSRLSLLKGRLKVPGFADISLGDIIELKGMGNLFSGKVMVSGIRHQVTSDGWTTDIQFGLSSEPFSTSANIIDSKAAGLLPGVNGLQIGIVLKNEEDPEKENRVKVKVPAIDDQNGIVWARLAMPDAGKQRGLIFYPETGDEVILGFLNDDPRQAIILGSVYSSANVPPIRSANNNPQKGIVTRQGIKLLFDDEKQLLTISTSDNNLISINEKERSIEIKDANNNTVTLSKDGILLDSGKDVIIRSKGNVKIEATAKVEIKGAQIDVI